MSNYIRYRVKGASYFFTIRLADRRSDLLTRHIDVLRRAMRDTMRRHPFTIEAICVLPDVIHTIWTLPDGDDDFPNRIGMVKSRFSRAFPVPQDRTPTQIRRGEKGIWQRRYWEHMIRGHTDMERHRSLIYTAPVLAGLCARPTLWPHSSLHRDLRAAVPSAAAQASGAGGRHLTHAAPQMEVLEPTAL